MSRWLAFLLIVLVGTAGAPLAATRGDAAVPAPAPPPGQADGGRTEAMSPAPPDSTGRGAPPSGGVGPAVRTVRVGGPGGPGRRPGSTTLAADTVVVPMEWSGHLPVVMVRVNGQGPYRFGLDTGAAGTARVDSALADRLGLRKIGEVRAGDPSGRNARMMALVSVDSIVVGGARFAAVLAAVRDYNEPGRAEQLDGILGFGLFADCLVTLDGPASRLVITRGELPPADGDAILDFSEERGVPRVRLNVAGTLVDADVDAGSMAGFSLPESLAEKLPLHAPPRVVGRARTVANRFEVKEANLEGEVMLGRHRFTNPTLEFQSVLPTANIGSRVLREFRATFDQRNHRLQLERGAPAAH